MRINVARFFQDDEQLFEERAEVNQRVLLIGLGRTVSVLKQHVYQEWRTL